ncbi:hypothetical protein F5Y09DRAFT_321919, partial [Xylaria sp. FL1042]
MRTLSGAAERLLESHDRRVLAEVARVFPECQPLLELARVRSQDSPPLANQSREDIMFLELRRPSGLSSFDDDCWKEVPSVSRELLFHAIEVASELDSLLPKERSSRHAILPGDLLELRSTYMPWAIPTTDEINYAIRKFDKGRWTDNKTQKGKICPFSAAAVAIKFLHNTPISTRKHIRKIIIHEDRQSVAYPQCHAKGFIPFCLENPLLRVERRLDLWSAVFFDFDYIDSVLTRQRNPSYWPATAATWITEAMDLFRAGMPKGSFSLVLNGNETAEASSSIFQKLQGDAAWQEAFDMACARNMFPTPSLRQIRTKRFYIREHFPKILRDMTNNKGFFIRCNFDIGSSRDIEPIIDQNRGCSLPEWEENWVRETRVFDGSRRGSEEDSSQIDRTRQRFVEEYIYPAERWRYGDERALRSTICNLIH